MIQNMPSIIDIRITNKMPSVIVFKYNNNTPCKISFCITIYIENSRKSTSVPQSVNLTVFNWDRAGPHTIACRLCHS